MKRYEKKYSGYVDRVDDEHGDHDGREPEIYHGVKSGRIEGHLATWDQDRGNDTFHRGAFLKSIDEMIRRGRDLRLKDMHGRTIGVFDRGTLHEDDKGLFGVGYINLEVQQGREAFSLAKQGAYDSFSVGFSIPDGGSDGEFPKGRDIFEAYLWEASIVDEPMNPQATITGVKSVTAFADLPLADDGLSWDSAEAEKRVRTWADADDEPNDRYKKAFLWFDADNAENFGSYRFPIADVIGGELMAVPKAISTAAAAIQGARAETTIPDDDKDKIRAHLTRYYEKMNKPAPWGNDKMLGELLGDESQIKEMTVREFEHAFIECGCSEKQARVLISCLKKSGKPGDHDNQETEIEEKNAELMADIRNEFKKFSDRLNV